MLVVSLRHFITRLYAGKLHKRLHDAGSDSERDVMQRQIEATDRQIDALVYELYGLTAAEVAVVEG